MKPKRNNAIETKLLPDGYVVLVNEVNNWAHTLTPTGALIWEFCDGETTVDEIFDRIIELTEQPADLELKNQILKLISDLQGVGLIEDLESKANRS